MYMDTECAIELPSFSVYNGNMLRAFGNQLMILLRSILSRTSWLLTYLQIKIWNIYILTRSFFYSFCEQIHFNFANLYMTYQQTNEAIILFKTVKIPSRVDKFDTRCPLKQLRILIRYQVLIFYWHTFGL